MIERKVKKLPFVDEAGQAAGPRHGARPDQAAAPAVRHARRSGPAPRRRRHRRDGRLPGAGRGTDQGGRRRARHRHRARPLTGHGPRHRRSAQALRRRGADCRQRGDRGGDALPARARRERDQGRHRARRRLHHAHDDELRRAAGAGAGRLPARHQHGRFGCAADCRRRDQAPRRARDGADVRRRLRDARKRLRRNRGDARRRRAQVGAPARSRRRP